MKNFLAITLLAILITSCNNEEKIENEKIEQNQELIKGLWETGKKYEIEETEDGSKSTRIRNIKEFNFTSTNDLICIYCSIAYNYNWSCTSDKLIIPGLSDEIEEYKIIVIDSEQLIVEGFKTFFNEKGKSEILTIRIELKRNSNS